MPHIPNMLLDIPKGYLVEIFSVLSIDEKPGPIKYNNSKFQIKMFAQVPIDILLKRPSLSPNT